MSPIEPHRFSETALKFNRRMLVLAGGAAAVSTLFPGCGGGDDGPADSGGATPAPPADPVAPLEATSVQVPMKVYGDDAYSVWHRRPLPLEAPRVRYPGFKPEKVLLKKGEIRRDGALPLPVDIVLERDVAVTLRDGQVMYTDVFRPAVDGNYPAIIAWSPYGKEIGNQWLDDIPGRSTVALSRVSELQKWEGPDPAFWVQQGYAVINPDPRGACKSGGNIYYWGRQMAEDSYDLVEWVAGQSWSNGKVGAAGNSWLAISQWFIAAEQPPHLAAIAPWEGFSDLMRDMALRGGIPSLGFAEGIIQMMAGEHLCEDQVKMTNVEQNDTLYWKDRAARFDRIKVPAYIVASYDNSLHTVGTLNAFQKIASADKWLRIHNTHEWADFYDAKYSAELLAFLDRYLKGLDNGWESTPRVRLSLLDPGGTDEVNRVVDAWPPSGYADERFYLNADSTLSGTPSGTEGVVAYAVAGGSAVFRVVIPQEAEIVGYMKLKLWVEAQGADDIDLVVQVQKRSSLGGALTRPNGQGASSPLVQPGYQRASRRKLDPARSMDSQPVLLLQGEERLSAGQVVPLEIAIQPVGLKIHAGEVLQVSIAPYTSGSSALPFGTALIKVPVDKYTYAPGETVATVTLGGPASTSPSWAAAQAQQFSARNAGTHVIHVGGQYDSHLLVPLRRV